MCSVSSSWSWLSLSSSTLFLLLLLPSLLTIDHSLSMSPYLLYLCFRPLANDWIFWPFGIVIVVVYSYLLVSGWCCCCRHCGRIFVNWSCTWRVVHHTYAHKYKQTNTFTLLLSAYGLFVWLVFFLCVGALEWWAYFWIC